MTPPTPSCPDHLTGNPGGCGPCATALRLHNAHAASAQSGLERVESMSNSEPRGETRRAAIDAVDLACVLMILDQRGPSTHHEIDVEYRRLFRHPRLTPDWLRAATVHLARAGYVEPDPIAGRGERGRKARRWRIARPLDAQAPIRARPDADLAGRFLAALSGIEPAAGYLRIDDAPRIEEDFTESPAVGIDGWVYRADLERILEEPGDANRTADDG